MKYLIRIVFLLLIITGVATSNAQPVDVRGVGTVQFDGNLFTGNPTDADKNKAIASAKLAAWKNYLASANPAKRKILMQHEAAVTENIDRFITNPPQIIEQKLDSNLKTLSIYVRMQVDNGAVDTFLESLTVGSAATGQGVARSQDSKLAFIFGSRTGSSSRQFDARRTNVESATSGVDVRDTNSGTATTATSERSVGGSTLRKADVTEYTVSSSQDIDTAMGEIITTAGIEYYQYDDIVTECHGPAPAQFKSEIAKDDELTPQTRSKMLAAAKQCEIRYFAYGTMDSGVSDADPATGSRRVVVSVRTQLWDISQRLPKKIAAVGPKQYMGLGSDESVARRNALQQAAAETARTLVDQLNAKGIR